MDQIINKNLFIQTLDEFNYTSSVNFFNTKREETAVLCLPGFENMFYNFNYINVSQIKNTNGILLSSNIKLKFEVYKALQKEALTYSNRIFTQFDINTGVKHIYEFMFSSLAKDMMTHSSELYRPFQKDYDDIRATMAGIDKKIVTINGRNLPGDRNLRNEPLLDLIEFLLGNNYFVINCTIPSVKYSPILNSESYIEVAKSDLYSYSRNISYFLNSNCLISIANSSGITNHICTKSNIILYGAGGWVDNPRFGYKNTSLFEASKQIKPTYRCYDFDNINDILASMEKPQDVSFFNESKIICKTKRF